MTKGQKVIITGTNSVWDDKEGIVEEINDDVCTVFVNFIPSEHKRVRQDFNIDNLKSETYNDNNEVTKMDEDLKLNEEDFDDEYNEEDNSIDIKIKKLAEYLGVDPEEIEISSWNDHVLEYGRQQYWVGTYDEAWDAAVEDVESLLDDMGLELFDKGIAEYFINKYADAGVIEEWQRESNYYYVEDIENESDSEFGNRLIQEMYNEGILTEDDFEEFNGEVDYTQLKDDVDIESKKEEFVDKLCEREDPIDWVQGMYTMSELSKVLDDNGLIDYNGIAEECVRDDGIAHSLASYDGDEIELDDDLYAYRQN